MKKFLIILLSFVLSAAAVNSHATAAPGTATTTIMVFGDSLSAGYGLPQDAGWVSLLKRRLQTQSQTYLINNSISGETAAGGRSRIGQALQARATTRAAARTAAVIDGIHQLEAGSSSLRLSSLLSCNNILFTSRTCTRCRPHWDSAGPGAL